MEIYFRELSLTKDFSVIKFRKSALFKDFAGVNLTFALKKIFPLTLVYCFENNLSKIQYFLPKKKRNSRWPQEALIQSMSFYLRAFILKKKLIDSIDTVSNRNCNIGISLILEKFCGN